MVVSAYNIENLFWNNKSIDKPEGSYFNSLIEGLETNFETNFSLNNLLNISISLPWEGKTFNYFGITLNNQNVYYLVSNIKFRSNTTVTYELELDIYVSFIIRAFNRTTTSINPTIFFTKKHMNRFTNLGSDIIGTDQLQQPYLFLQNQQTKEFNNLDQLYYYVPTFLSNTTPVSLFQLDTEYFDHTVIDDTQFLYSNLPEVSKSFPPEHNIYLYAILQESPVVGATENKQTVFPFAIAPVITLEVPSATMEQYFLNMNTLFSLGETMINLVLLPYPPSIFGNIAIHTYTISTYTNTNTLGRVGQNCFSIPGSINLGNQYNFLPTLPPTIFNAPYDAATGTYQLNTVEFEPFINLLTQEFYLQNGTEEVNLELFRTNINSPLLQPGNIGLNFLLNRLTLYTDLNDWLLGFNGYFNMTFVNLKNSENNGIHKNFNIGIPTQSILPSLSNNWTTYLNNSQNQYALNKNMNTINITTAVASTVASTVAAAADLASAADPFSTSEGVAAGGQMALSLINSSANIAKGALQNEYLNHGMAKDLGRVGTMRAANSPNHIMQNFASPVICQKVTNPFNQEIIFQEFARNGYLVNRYLPLNSWYNRMVFNFIAIDNFVEVLNLNSVVNIYTQDLTESINTILSRGIRIWNQALDWSLIPKNVEVNFYG